jgi:electron transfer flavoprotein beta subunit
MKVLVCIKQVPDMESKFKINADANWFDENDLAYRINEYDEYAIEQAVQLKEQTKDADITVLCVGAVRVKEALKKALAMGCDRAVHIEDENASKKESSQIAEYIADFAKDKGFDIIFTGMQSQDRGSAQVGVLISELLNISCVSTIADFEYSDSITVKRELEGGLKSIVKVETPVVLTCQLGLNTPRYPTLPNIMKAKKKEMLSISSSDLKNSEKLSDTLQFYYPEKSSGCLILEGDDAELADKLIAILKEKTSVL